MTTRMIQRRGLASQWTAINPILEIGEFGFEEDTQKFKVGDGESNWTELPYYLNEDLLPDVVALLTAANEQVQSSISTAVSTAVAGLVDSAPAALNTLNELAAAIADDATFANTITNALANKADSSHTHSLDGLSDVSVASATTGQVLQKNADGSWKPYSIPGAAAVSYNDLLNIPTSFTPSSHTHQSTDIANATATISTTAYNIASGDHGKLIRSTSASAVTITVDNVLTPGQKIDFYQKGAGYVKFVAGVGATLEAIGITGGTFRIASQYSAASILCESSGVYAIIGNVETV